MAKRKKTNCYHSAFYFAWSLNFKVGDTCEMEKAFISPKESASSLSDIQSVIVNERGALAKRNLIGYIFIE